MERFIDVIGLDSFSVYIQDYGAPIGLTIASTQPDRVRAIVSQSGNAYMEGFTPFGEPLFAYATDRTPENEAKVSPLLTAEANVWQWTHGTRDPEHIDPDLPVLDTMGFDRPGNREVQLDLFYDYRLNLDKYPWVPAVLPRPPAAHAAGLGQDDEIFGPDGAQAFLKDLPDAGLHLLDTGHFALEEEGDFIAARIREFLTAHTA